MSESFIEQIKNRAPMASVLDSMFAESIRLEAAKMASEKPKPYIAKNHYIPEMVRECLHEEDLQEAPMLYCDRTSICVACPFCPLTHLHIQGATDKMASKFAMSHCQKGVYKFGDLLTGDEIHRLIHRNRKAAASKRLYKEKMKAKELA
jgi:hypothetical protein